MTDHQVILAGVWGVTFIMWGTKNVSGVACLVMTGISLYISFN